MTGLPKFILKRLAAMVVIILLLTAIIFLLQRLSGINPVHAYLGANASKAAIAKESAILGYNKPVLDQYFHYVDRAGARQPGARRCARAGRSRPTSPPTCRPPSN